MHYKIVLFYLFLANLPNCKCEIPKRLQAISPCPDGFDSDEENCILILGKTTYNESKCPYKGELPFEHYQETTLNLNQSYLPVWMPIKKNIHKTYGFEPFKWVEISDKYGVEFSGYLYNGTLKDKDCIVYVGNDIYRAVSCDEKYNKLCVYRQIHLMSNDYCQLKYDPLCVKSDYNLNANCACIKGINHTEKMLEFLHPYQNYIYSKLSNYKSYIGLINNDSGAYWMYSNLPINYSFWDENVNKKNKYGAITVNGWFLEDSSSKLQYSLFSIDIVERKNATINLVFKDSNILVIITNYKELFYQNECYPLVICLTDSSPATISNIFFNSVATRIVPTVNDTTLTYKISNIEHLPGIYECIGFEALDLTPVYSTSIYQYGVCQVVGYFEKKYTTNPFEDANHLYTQFKSILDKDITPRLVKIMNIYEEELTYNFIMHFSVQRPLSCVSNYEATNMFKAILKELVDVKITYLSSNLLYYCHSQIFTVNNQDLFVPTTKIGKEAFTKELCFTKSGKRKRYYCVGNFIDAPHWETDNATCTILESSEYTDELDQILKNSSEKNPLGHAYTLSSNYKNLTSIDVHLLVSIIEKIGNETNNNLVLGIIENILNVANEALVISQEFFKATDHILRFIVSMKSYVFDEGLISRYNFYVVSKNIRGIAFNKVLNYTHFIRNDADIIKVKEDSRFPSGLILSEKLYEALNATQYFLFIFHKNVFFQDPKLNLTDNQIIYGIKTNKPIEYPFSIFNKNKNFGECLIYNLSKTDAKTSFWTYNENKNDTDCLYKEQGFFTMSEISVTESLQNILNSNLPIAEKLDQLKQITEKSKSFIPEDINCISQILELAAYSSECNLPATTSIISVVLTVNPDVLKQSQREYNATDKILYYTDLIVIKPEKDINATSENFATITMDLTDTNITGITLDNCKDSCDIKIVENRVNTLKNIDAAVILSDELLDQLKNNENSSYVPKLVITIYYSSSLFIDDVRKGDPGIIFGVLLPEFNQSFDGNVSIIYNLTNIVENTCAFWDYSIYDYPGFWREEHQLKTLDNILICSYSHLTHFAMLLGLDIEDKYHILEIITDVCCGLSLLGIVGIMMTGLLFKKWRKNTGNHILLNFVLAISLKILLLYINNLFFNERKINKTKCIVLGAILHYSLMSEFCWMLIIAILQFKRFVEVLGGPPKFVLVKAYVCGWMLPLIPVTCILITDKNNYTKGNAGLCYPSGLGLYLGVWLPISIILVFNIFIFYYIMYNVCIQKTECRERINHESMFQWRLALLLFFMLGLTWTFGFLAQIKDSHIFMYLFCTTATLQGFIMFLFFIVFNKSTRVLYSRTLIQLKNSNSSNSF